MPSLITLRICQKSRNVKAFHAACTLDGLNGSAAIQAAEASGD